MVYGEKAFRALVLVFFCPTSSVNGGKVFQHHISSLVSSAQYASVTYIQLSIALIPPFIAKICAQLMLTGY